MLVLQPVWCRAGGEAFVASLEPESDQPRQNLGPLLKSACRRRKQRQQGRLQRTSGKQEGRVSSEEEDWPSGLIMARI